MTTTSSATASRCAPSEFTETDPTDTTAPDPRRSSMRVAERGGRSMPDLWLTVLFWWVVISIVTALIVGRIVHRVAPGCEFTHRHPDELEDDRVPYWRGDLSHLDGLRRDSSPSVTASTARSP
jgi:hypothetical protein